MSRPILFDAKELKCPEFQIQLRRFLSKQEANTLVIIVTSEPAAPRDTKLYCGHSGHSVIDEDNDGEWIYLLVEVGPK